MAETVITQLEDRKRREAQFHDQLRAGHIEQRWSVEAEEGLTGNPEWSNFKWYCIERRSLDHVRERLARLCRGKAVLDYCCGNGLESLWLAKNGAREVAGIDISLLSIDNCREQASRERLTNLRFDVMDAEAMNFSDNTFDVITEYGCLHHLDLTKALPELARVMKPEGEMIATEVLGHNPAIHWYRRSTPHLRTEWEVEHILRKRDIKLATRYFDRVDVRCFHLATLAAVPFRRMTWFPRLLNVLEAIDDVLLKLPFVKWQAWMVVITMSGPKKARTRP